MHAQHNSSCGCLLQVLAQDLPSPCAHPSAPQIAMLSKGKRPYDPEQLDPRTRLRRNVQDLFSTSAISSNRLSEVVRDINRVDESSLNDLCRASTTSHANHHRDMMRKFAKSSTWMSVYWAEVRCKDIRSGAIKKEWMAFNLIHEVVHTLHKHSILDKLMCTDDMDTLARQHLDACEAEAGCKLLGLGLWADGTPCNWDRTESVETLSLLLPGLSGEYKNLRLPVTALSGKHVCAETWVDICAVVKWSFQILATGQWPTSRHDGTPWRKSDCKRVKPRYIPRSCLVEVRADWDWMAKVYGFPPHNLLAGCCWKCPCTPAQVMGSEPLERDAIHSYLNI